MSTPIIGVPITPASEAPANHAAGMAAAFEHIETFVVMRFVDASDRDTKVTTPVEGMKCWLDSPGRYEDYRGGEWVPEGRPAHGQVTLQHTARPTNDRSVTSESASQVGPAIEFPVPSWAREGDSYVRVSCQPTMHIVGPADILYQIEHSFDAGASWVGSGIARAQNGTSATLEYTGLTSNGNDNSNIVIPAGTTTVRTRVQAWRQSGSGTGSLELVANRTLFLWQCSFYHSSTPQAVTL